MNKRILTVLIIMGILMAGAATYSYAADAQKLYIHHCAQCHGPKGDGKGPQALRWPQRIIQMQKRWPS